MKSKIFGFALLLFLNPQANASCEGLTGPALTVCLEDQQSGQNPNQLNNSGIDNYQNNSSNNINDNANTGAASQGAGAGVNAAAGGALMALCMMGCPGACMGCMCWACPLAALAFAQSGHDSGAQNQSQGVADITIPGGGSFIPGEQIPSDGTGIGGTSPTPTNPGSGTDAGNIKADVDKLKDLGFVVDTKKGTVTTPNGTFPIEQFNTPEGLLGAGYSQENVNMAKSKLAEINSKANQQYKDKMKVISQQIDASRGGAQTLSHGGSSASASKSYFDDFLKDLKKKNKHLKNPKPSIKRQAGLAIGIAPQSSNIFQMVHKRYQKLRNRKYFIEPHPSYLVQQGHNSPIYSFTGGR